MDLYQLGKDIQAIHEKLDKLTGKKCGCSKGAQSDTPPHEVRISRAVVKQLIEQLHFLAAVASGKDFVTGAPMQQTWEDFLKKYNPESIFDWCCRCDGSFGDRHCTNITALSEAEALVTCSVGHCLSGGASVTFKKCGPSDDCDFGP
jgi:hypothetical protein